MDPARLRDLLAVLREAGVKRAKVPAAELYKGVSVEGAVSFSHAVLEVEFDDEPESNTPAAAVPEGAVLIDKRTGQPVDLDEGAPDLARDPGDAIRGANFPPKT